METIDMVFGAIYNMLSVYVGIRVIELFLVSKDRSRKISLPLYIGTWLVNSVVYYVPNSGIMPTRLSIFLCFIALAIFLYEGNWKRKVLAVISAMGMGIIVENIVWISSNVLGAPLENAALGCLYSGVLELLIVVLIEKILSFDRYAVLPVGGYLSIGILSVGSVMVAEIISEEVHSHELSMIALSIICILNISTYYIYQKIAENYKEGLQRTMLIEENRMYVKQMEILRQSQEYVRVLRHDMKNHMQLIHTWLESGEYEKAKEYVGKLGEKHGITQEYVRTENIEVDSILNYKLDLICRHLKCVPQIYIEIPRESIMPEVDLNIILGNLLDNAAEAMEKAKEKYLNLQMTFEKNILYISLYNSFDGKLETDKDGKIRTRKADRSEHGIGLRSIDLVVKKYNGTIRILKENYIFKVDLILYTKAAVGN